MSTPWQTALDQGRETFAVEGDARLPQVLQEECGLDRDMAERCAAEIRTALVSEFADERIDPKPKATAFYRLIKANKNATWSARVTAQVRIDELWDLIERAKELTSIDNPLVLESYAFYHLVLKAEDAPPPAQLRARQRIDYLIGARQPRRRSSRTGQQTLGGVFDPPKIPTSEQLRAAWKPIRDRWNAAGCGFEQRGDASTDEKAEADTPAKTPSQFVTTTQSDPTSNVDASRDPETTPTKEGSANVETNTNASTPIKAESRESSLKAELQPSNDSPIWLPEHIDDPDGYLSDTEKAAIIQAIADAGPNADPQKTGTRAYLKLYDPDGSPASSASDDAGQSSNTSHVSGRSPDQPPTDARDPPAS